MMQDEREELRQARFEDVWDALEDTPEAAINMRARSDLMIRVQQEVAAWGHDVDCCRRAPRDHPTTAERPSAWQSW